MTDNTDPRNGMGLREYERRLLAEVAEMRVRLTVATQERDLASARAEKAELEADRLRVLCEVTHEGRERVEAELEELRAATQDLPLGTHGLCGPHSGPGGCPTYYDYCHCTVESLEHNIARAEKAEGELERLRELTCGTCGRALPPDGDCYGCECDRLQVDLARLREGIERLASEHIMVRTADLAALLEVRS